MGTELDGLFATNPSDWKERCRSSSPACAVCGSTERLHVHHKAPRRGFPALWLYIPNGIVLCCDCHHKAEPSRGPMSELADQWMKEVLVDASSRGIDTSNVPAYGYKLPANFYLDKDVKRALADRSEATGQPQSYIVEQALRRYLGAGQSKGGR